MNTQPSDSPSSKPQRWYSEVTGYQWLVLAIASAGWIFDTFEGQIFNVTRANMLGELLGNLPAEEKSKLISQWGDWLLAFFLIGGTFGGIVFGSLADRFGRKPTMAVTILFYSVFSGLTYFATEVWQVAALRFLVALGVGGEWAVAAALVADVFPPRARAHASGIFHSTSILGTWLAGIAGMLIAEYAAPIQELTGKQPWRFAYLIGVAPALLVLWVRSGIHEPERWQQATAEKRRMGSFKELFGTWRWARSALLGIALATVGLGMFWAVTIAGQDLTKALLLKNGVSPEVAAKEAVFAYTIVETTGAGLGLLSFGPLAQRWGRKPAFAFMHIGALAIVPLTCFLPQTYGQMLAILPVFGFFTLGMHAGYAVYFPELFPDHLRATGTGLCFNGGRLLSAAFLVFSGWVKGLVNVIPGFDLGDAVSLLSLFFALGLVVLIFLPETKGRPLPR
jgi:MFS family permease